MGGKAQPGVRDSAIGWAVFGLTSDVLAEGETTFRPDQTDAQKIAEAVAQYKLLRKQHGRGTEIELFRYTRASFPRSRPASEGMTYEHHREQLQKLRSALMYEGATVVFRTV